VEERGREEREEKERKRGSEQREEMNLSEVLKSQDRHPNLEFRSWGEGR
jgi:hypothetical protein